MNTERKYRKQINKNGWMRNIQVWSFGDKTPQFVGYCPFFWFTWLCVFLSPWIAVGKVCEFLGSAVLACWPKAPEGKVSKTKRSQPSHETLVTFYNYLAGRELDSLSRSEQAGWWEEIEWASQTPNWKAIAQKAVAKDALNQERKKRKALRRQALEAFIKKVSNYSGYIVKPLLVVSALFVAYLVLKFSLFLISLVTWGAVLSVFSFALLILLSAGLVSFVATMSTSIKQKWDALPEPEPALEVSSGGEGWPLFERILECISNILTFIKETVSMLYTQECPLIEWSDESKPIERIEKKPEDEDYTFTY